MAAAGDEATVRADLDATAVGPARGTCVHCRTPLAATTTVRLACFHVMCEACAKAVLSSSSAAATATATGGPGLPCPVCQTRTVALTDDAALARLRRRDHLIEAEAAAAAAAAPSDKKGRDGVAGRSSKCVACSDEVDVEDARATVVCTDCHPQRLLCDDHASLHRKAAATKSHTLTPATADAALLRCATHQRLYEGYCATCDELGCPVCMLQQHPAPAHAAALATPDERVRVTTALAAAAAAARARQGDVVARLVTLTQAQASLAEEAESVRAQVAAAFAALRSAATAREEELLAEIGAFVRGQETLLAAAVAAHRTVYAAMQGPLSVADAVASQSVPDNSSSSSGDTLVGDVGNLPVVAMCAPAIAKLKEDAGRTLPATYLRDRMSFKGLDDVIKTVEKAGGIVRNGTRERETERQREKERERERESVCLCESKRVISRTSEKTGSNVRDGTFSCLREIKRDRQTDTACVCVCVCVCESCCEWVATWPRWGVH
jgi:hypothetical protein